MVITISGTRAGQGVSRTIMWSVVRTGIFSYYVFVYPIALWFLGDQGRFKLGMENPLCLGQWRSESPSYQCGDSFN